MGLLDGFDEPNPMTEHDLQRRAARARHRMLFEASKVALHGLLAGRTGNEPESWSPAREAMSHAAELVDLFAEEIADTEAAKEAMEWMLRTRA